MRKRFFRWLDKHLSAQHQQYPVLHRGDYQKHADISLYSYADLEAMSYTTPLASTARLSKSSNFLSQVILTSVFIALLVVIVLIMAS